MRSVILSNHLLHCNQTATLNRSDNPDINGIYNSSEKLSFYLFADDTNLLYADKDLKV